MSLSKFRILELPYVAFNEVVQQMEVNSFWLAHVSKKAARRVQSCRVPLDLKLQSKEACICLELSPTQGKKSKTALKRPQKQHQKLEIHIEIGDLKKEGYPRKLNVEGITVPVKMAVEESKMLVNANNQNCIQSFETVSDWLKHYFKITFVRFDSSCWYAVSLLDSCFEVFGPTIQQIHLFEKVNIWTLADREDFVRLTPEKLEKILDSNLQFLRMGFCIPVNFSYAKPLQITNLGLNLDNARWISVENLKNLNCNGIELKNLRFTKEDVNEILYCLVSETMKVKYITLMIFNNGSWGIEDIMEGIEYIVKDEFYWFPQPSPQWKLKFVRNTQEWITLDVDMRRYI